MLRSVNGHYYNNDIEITENEYTIILAEIHEKINLVKSVYDGDITIDDCPIEWREEIAERVEQRRHEHDEDEDIPIDEALDILLGGAL